MLEQVLAPSKISLVPVAYAQAVPARFGSAKLVE